MSIQSKEESAPVTREATDPAPAADGDGAAPIRSARELSEDLHVHQIELEMQNEELRRTQLDLAAARDRFIDLYDFAPIGYFTLNRQGAVIEANLTGAAMLGQERRSLLNRRFVGFVKTEDASRWQHHLLEALQRDEVMRIELALKPRAAAPFHGQLDCLRAAPAGAAPTLRVTLTDITARKQAEMDRRIATSAIDAREADRRRVARELHEGLGQRLSALKMDLASLRPALDDSARAPRIPAMLTTIDEVLAMVRRMAADLRPLMLDDLGLNAAVDWLARDWARRLGLDITLSLDDGDPPVDERTSIAVYRLLQEVLAHIVRYAHASEVTIALRHRAGKLLLTVSSNGTGWPMPPAQGHEDADAVLALCQQAQMQGGQLTLVGGAGGGLRFTLRLPLSGGAPAGR